MRPGALSSLAFVSVLLAACGSVPSIRFVEGDGGVDAADSAATTSEAGSEAGTDAGPGCPTQPPPGADGCCGVVPCAGAKCEKQCAKCTSCTAAQYCCARGATACIAAAPDAVCQ